MAGFKSLSILIYLFVIFLIVLGSDSSAGARLQITRLGPQPLWNSTFTDQLRHDLLLNYDKFARPAQHYNVTKVKLGMNLIHVDLNEFKSILTVHTWLSMSWDDEKLKWDPSKYGGIVTLNLADHELWQPDIFLYNSATNTAINHYNTPCVVQSTGRVLWIPPAQLAVLCNLNLKYWPFDTQNCYLEFGSWTYSGDQIDLDVYNNDTKVKLELLIENNEWKITQTAITRKVTYYDCCTEPYPSVNISIYMNRVSATYKALIITPAIVIIFLTLLCYWLPPNAGEKIIINACTAIIICLFMLYFTQKLPAMGSQTPLIVLFYSSCLYIITFSMIGSVVVITISRTKHTNCLPWIIKQRLIGKFGKYLGLSAYIPQKSNIQILRVTAEEMRDHQVTDFDDVHTGDEHDGIVPRHRSEKPSYQEDWILLAAAIDKISFIFYALLFIILAIVYSI